MNCANYTYQKYENTRFKSDLMCILLYFYEVIYFLYYNFEKNIMKYIKYVSIDINKKFSLIFSCRSFVLHF